MKNKYISVSTHLASNNVIEYVKEILNTNADFIHCDIMDGEFVNNITFGTEKVAEINEITAIPLDIHYMVSNPSIEVKKCIKFKPNIVTLHYESYNNVNKLIQDLKILRKNNIIAGISIKPRTNIDVLINLFNYIDLVLVMCVEPGASGQRFIDSSYEKIESLNSLRKQLNYNYLIEVDGGVNLNNASVLYEKGADILVVGSFIFSSKNKEAAINKLRV